MFIGFVRTCRYTFVVGFARVVFCLEGVELMSSWFFVFVFLYFCLDGFLVRFFFIIYLKWLIIFCGRLNDVFLFVYVLIFRICRFLFCTVKGEVDVSKLKILRGGGDSIICVGFT